jgi:hypothetical protein
VLGRATEMKESTVLALGGGTYAQPAAPNFCAPRALRFCGWILRSKFYSRGV